MLVREALRRLATPLALMEVPGAPVPTTIEARYQAVRVLMRCWPELTFSVGR
jgi:hypothetical protein